MVGRMYVNAPVSSNMMTTTETVIAGVPIKLPMVDVHTVSAGGGSITWADAGGALRVGPHSAGAEPGPAAYDAGGEELAVYVTLSDPGADRVALVPRLHDLLRTRLPEYMVPGYIDVLDSLPTQVSGKVDRSKLPAPAAMTMVGASSTVSTFVVSRHLPSSSRSSRSACWLKWNLGSNGLICSSRRSVNCWPVQRGTAGMS